MPDSLKSAVEFAERIRFSGDHMTARFELDRKRTDKISHYFAQTGLRISASLTPEIFDVLQTVCGRLNIDSESVGAYAYSDPGIQAGCFAGNNKECVIRVSSGLINLMSDDELCFVLGHEIAHFLLGHNLPQGHHNLSTEHFIQSRCQEISADRLGLVACQSLEIAIRSLMKTTSGLNDDLLRFDVGSFLDQMRSQRGERVYADEGDSHPSLVMRCRALLWFSMSDAYFESIGNSGGESFEKIDKRITKDLEKYVDGPAREKIAEARQGITIWLAACASIRDGAFDKKEQKIFRDLVGEKFLQKLLQFYSSCNQNEVKNMTRERILDAMSLYQQIAPKEFSESFGEIQSQIAAKFKQPDFSSFLSEFINADK